MTEVRGKRDDEGGRNSVLSHLIHKPDLIISITILAICGLLYFWTTFFDKIPEILSQNITAEWFPRLLLGTIVVLALIIPFEHLFFSKGRDHIDSDRKARIEPMSLKTAGLLILMVSAITVFGTYIAMVLTTIFLPLLWGERRIKGLIVYLTLFPLVVWFVFTHLLKVYFEPGMLLEFFE